MTNTQHKQRKQSEAARKGAQVRAAQKHAQEQWERRQNESELPRDLEQPLPEYHVDNDGHVIHDA